MKKAFWVTGLLVVLGLGSLAVAAAFFVLALVCSIGTNSVHVTVNAAVLERATDRPVANCLLVFDQDRYPDSRTSRGRTDNGGRASYDAGFYQYMGAGALPFQRQRDPDLRFYFGDKPRFDTADQTESWRVRLNFKAPWWGREVSPDISVDRSLAHEDRTKPLPDGTWPSAGFVAMGADAKEKRVRATVHFEKTADGRAQYRIPLTLWLDREQIAACQAEPALDTENRAVRFFNDRQYAEALDAYEAVIRTGKAGPSAYLGRAQCLELLGRAKDAAAAYRAALAQAPNEKDTLYAYANALILQDDKEAVAQFKKLVALEPDNARGWIGMANALYELDRFRETVQAFDRARKICVSCLNDNDRKIQADAKRLAS